MRESSPGERNLDHEWGAGGGIGEVGEWKAARVES